jgi:hypothetical protein
VRYNVYYWHVNVASAEPIGKADNELREGTNLRFFKHLLRRRAARLVSLEKARHLLSMDNAREFLTR